MSEEDRKCIKVVLTDSEAANEKSTILWDYENRYEGYPLFKKNKKSKVWWVNIYDQDGTFVFTIDKKKFFHLYRDYSKMSKEEKEIFDKSEPFWAAFFSHRKRR